MRDKYLLQLEHLISELVDSVCERIVLLTVEVTLVLKVCKPLLLPLSTLQSSNTDDVSACRSNARVINSPIPFKEILSFLLISHFSCVLAVATVVIVVFVI
jgi:hypothetical protein